MTRSAFCLLVAAACASPVAPDPVDAGVPSDVVDASRYCEEAAPFFCSFYLRCGRLAAADDAECRRVFLSSCSSRYEPRYAALADAGLVELSRAGLEACRAHLESVACDAQVTDLDGRCAGLWVGTSSSGAPCGLDVESLVCAPGLKCVLDLTFCGRCVPEAADGEACDATNQTCRTGSSCVEGKCVARGRPGAACSQSSDCVIGTTCAQGRCAGPTRAAEGGSCAAGERCPYRTACVTGKCLRQGLLGEPCDAAGCASGYCKDGSCVELLPPGASCAKSSQCTSAACTDGVCQPTPGRCLR